MTSFSKGKVEISLNSRQGNCHQCGSCCRLVFKCPFLGSDDRCAVYNSSLRPIICKKFPMGQRDIHDVLVSSGGQCGYHFSDVSEVPAKLIDPKAVPPFITGEIKG